MSGPPATIDDVQTGLDAYFSYLNNEWTSPLLMEMHVGFDCHYSTKAYQTDVNEFIGNPVRSFSFGEHAYFSREKFPAPSSTPSRSQAHEAFQALYYELICSARNSGFELVQKGRVPQSHLSRFKNSTATGCPFDAWDLICGRYYTYSARVGKHAGKENAVSISSQDAIVGSIDYGEYRQTKLHGDRFNTRGLVGKTLPRRRTTNKAMSSAECCKYGFRVYLDQHGFYQTHRQTTHSLRPHAAHAQGHTCKATISF